MNNSDPLFWMCLLTSPYSGRANCFPLFFPTSIEVTETGLLHTGFLQQPTVARVTVAAIRECSKFCWKYYFP